MRLLGNDSAFGCGTVSACEVFVPPRLERHQRVYLADEFVARKPMVEVAFDVIATERAAVGIKEQFARVIAQRRATSAFSLAASSGSRPQGGAVVRVGEECTSLAPHDA